MTISKESQTISSDDYVNLMVMTLSRQKFDRLVTYHRIHNRPLLMRTHMLLTNLTQLQLTSIRANYSVGQIHRGLPNQNFGWAMANSRSRSAPPHGLTSDEHWQQSASDVAIALRAARLVS